MLKSEEGFPSPVRRLKVHYGPRNLGAMILGSVLFSFLFFSIMIIVFGELIVFVLFCNKVTGATSF